MKFEDLFVKQRPPKDYVSYPPQETPTLEKFFQERVVKEQKASQPITPQKEQIIKQNFALPPAQPQQQSMPQDGMDAEFDKAVAQETPDISAQQRSPAIMEESISTQTPSINMPDFSKEKDLSLSDKAEKMLPERTWKDYLPYLTPLLVEGLMGTNADAAGIAGTALMGAESDRIKRKQSLEDKLLEMDKAKLSRKMASVKFQPKSLRDKTTGESLIGSYDPTTDTMYVGGKPVDTSKYELAPGLSRQEFEARSGITQQRQQELGDYFGRGVRLDPDTGLLSRVINGKLVPLQVQKGQLNPKQTRDLEKIIGSFRTTDVYKKNADTLRFTGTLRGLIEEGNPVSLEMAKSELAKAAEGGGRLTDEDVARLGGSRALKDQAKRFAYLQRTGEGATPKDTYFMMRVADILEERARKNLSQSVVGLEQDFMQRGGIPGAVQTAFNPYAPQLYQNPSANAPKPDMVLVTNLATGKNGYIPKANLKKALESKKFSLVNKK